MAKIDSRRWPVVGHHKHITMASYGKILVILQKTDCSDNLLTITPDADSTGYFVDFKQTDINTTNSKYVENDNLSHYLHLFFQSIEFDHQKCDYIQIDVPSFPSVILAPNDLSYYMDILEDQIESLQDDWPAEMESAY